MPAASAAPAAAVQPRELSGDELETMLAELVAAYGAPEFQRSLEALKRAAVEGRGSLLLTMGPFVLQAQAPILERYGQPGNAQGVDLMKHSVERRVAEGRRSLEALANEARRLLGLAPMPDRRRSAEHVLAAKADETRARFGLMGGGADAEAELVRECRARIQADGASGALPSRSAACLDGLLAAGEVPLPAVLSMHKMAKLGISAEDLRGDDVPMSIPTLERPPSDDFFRECVLPNRPAVLRGVLDADSFPPLRDFPDTAYLRRACGHRRVCVKSLAHDDASGRPVFVSDPELKLPLSAFLEAVDAHESSGSRQPFYLGKVPLRRELPELAEDIERAPSCPRRAYGDCFGSLVPSGVFTYFGCGRNTTPVHWDAHENLLLCVCGTKRLFLYPPSDARHLYPCNDLSRSAVLPFSRFGDLPAELKEKFALVEGARPLEVTLRAGDILYLPSTWWHCVEGSDDRNMILNWWFEFHPKKKALAFGSS